MIYIYTRAMLSFTAAKPGVDGRVSYVRREAVRFRNITSDPGRYRNPRNPRHARLRR